MRLQEYVYETPSNVSFGHHANLSYYASAYTASARLIVGLKVTNSPKTGCCFRSDFMCTKKTDFIVKGIY